jgi:hypothetical protein
MLRNIGKIPQIDLQKAPEMDRQDMRLLNNALNEIDYDRDRFLDALTLFDYCSAQASASNGTNLRFENWRFIAARDASMTVYNFRQSMFAANDLANKSNYVKAALNLSALKEANSKFDNYFSDFRDIRDAVGHSGELAKNQFAYEKNSFSGDYIANGIHIKNVQKLIIKDSLVGRKYTCTIKGKIVDCEISAQSFAQLNEVENLFYSAFMQAPSAPPEPSP